MPCEQRLKFFRLQGRAVIAFAIMNISRGILFPGAICLGLVTSSLKDRDDSATETSRQVL
jgi:hypothetical protein